jgi:Ser/Thr protein kinase RdoA (MazF antagonist)
MSHQRKIDSMSSDALQILCTSCLDAFGLTLASENDQGASLKFLKNDEASIVIKARCNQDGAIQDFVLKGTPVSTYRQSAANTAIETLLADNDQGIVVPARRLSTDGQHTHIARGFSAREEIVWSVTTFEPNTASFDWLQSQPTWTGKQTYSAGVLLAKSHIALKQLKVRLLEIGYEIEPAIPARVPQLLLDAFENAGSDYLAQMRIENREYERLIAIVCKAALNIEDGLHAEALKAAEIVVHGDFQPGNVLYRGDSAYGLIDWDYARLDNPLTDLAYGLIMYSANLCLEEAVAFNSDLAHEFLQGYAVHLEANGHELPVCMPDISYSPSSRDARAFSDYMKLSAALIMLWSLSEYGQRHRSGVTVGRRTVQLIQGT